MTKDILSFNIKTEIHNSGIITHVIEDSNIQLLDISS